MKQTIFIVLLISSLGLTHSLSAQNDKQAPPPDDIAKKRLDYAIEHRPPRIIEQAVEIQVNDNRYNHREKEILGKLNTDAIPFSFPQYKPEYTNEQYTELMKKWYIANPTLLKETNSNQQK